MKNTCLGVLTSTLVALALLIPTASAAAQTPPPVQPWKKTCDFGVAGGEGCVVTVEMRNDPAEVNPCAPVASYCVLIKVVCPPNNPPGDPGETCSEETCGVCATSGQAISITCDGVKFEVKPKDGGQNWGTVAKDCGNAGVTAS